ncbi:uncharacterized protein LY79DRAFT_517932 [Colletotrichum navitas]|uniref:Uncharacterized protein n=1 Tax=Colletotrichum navitas TaxID=681940 RepID=A0AAD8V4L7_9PEZI|nr:uncharacterized protein LY79DRAFT_517932 [Colletotrichum navitas]KAK1585879.1 hypothetical protein LY79DRAFT_517932 [Colletotrichum navitas]
MAVVVVSLNYVGLETLFRPFEEAAVSLDDLGFLRAHMRAWRCVLGTFFFFSFFTGLLTQRGQGHTSSWYTMSFSTWITISPLRERRLIMGNGWLAKRRHLSMAVSCCICMQLCCPS